MTGVVFPFLFLQMSPPHPRPQAPSSMNCEPRLHWHLQDLARERCRGMGCGSHGVGREMEQSFKGGGPSRGRLVVFGILPPSLKSQAGDSATQQALFNISLLAWVVELGGRHPAAWVPVLLFISCVTSDKLLYFSGLVSLSFKMRVLRVSAFLGSLWESDGWMCVKCVPSDGEGAQCLFC